MFGDLQRPANLSGKVRRIRLTTMDSSDDSIVIDGEPFSGIGYVLAGIDTYEAIRVTDGVPVGLFDDPLFSSSQFRDLSVDQYAPDQPYESPDWWYRGEPFTGLAIRFDEARVSEVTQVDGGVPTQSFSFAESGALIGLHFHDLSDMANPDGLESIDQWVRWSPSGAVRWSKTGFSFRDRRQAVTGEILLTSSGKLRKASFTDNYFNTTALHGDRLSFHYLDDLSIFSQLEFFDDRLVLGLGDRSDEMVAQLASRSRLGQVEQLEVILYPGGLDGLKRLVAMSLPALRSLDVAPSVNDEVEIFELLLGLKRRRPELGVALRSWELHDISKLHPGTDPGYGFYFTDEYSKVVGVVGLFNLSEWSELAHMIESLNSLRFIKVRLPGSLRVEEDLFLSRLSARPEIAVVGPEVRASDWVPQVLQQFAE